MEYRDRYWMVHNPKNQDRPVIQHATEGAATEEAERLAALQIGDTFYVLEAVAAYQVIIPRPQRIYMQYPVREITEEVPI